MILKGPEKGILKGWEGGLKGVLGRGFEAGSSALEEVYSGCMGWVLVPPPPLAAP
jgi:hypothetical protein